MKYFILLLISISFCACSGDESDNSNKNKEPKLIVTTFNLDTGFGFFIEKDSKLIIKQLNIPAIQGNQLFKNELDAFKVGNLMVTKINSGIFPPTIDKEELDSLGIYYE